MRRRGYTTLVDLLVVIAVITIISVIMLALFNEPERIKRFRTAVRNDVWTIHSVTYDENHATFRGRSKNNQTCAYKAPKHDVSYFSIVGGGNLVGRRVKFEVGDTQPSSGRVTDAYTDGYLNRTGFRFVPE